MRGTERVGVWTVRNKSKNRNSTGRATICGGQPHPEKGGKSETFEMRGIGSKGNNFVAVGRIWKNRTIWKIRKNAEIPSSTNGWVSVSKQQGARLTLLRSDASGKRRKSQKIPDMKRT